MKYLLDTHTFIWWIDNSKKLSTRWREAIEDSENIIYVSVATVWEMSIKMRSKKLKLKTAFEDCFAHLEFDLVDISLSHIQELHQLPLHHKDPFDRILLAQALVEGCTLITSDMKFQKYRVPLLS